MPSQGADAQVSARAAEAGSVWPIVGRREELAVCLAALGDPAARGVVVAGAAGVGKTRLVREALAAASASGRATVRATATEAARTIPLGALSHLLPPESSRAPTTLDLLRHARAAFAGRTGTEPLVLGLDDAHLLDPASATLVLQLVSGDAAFVFATVRTDEPVPDAVTALWKDEGCLSLELQPLSRAETDGLLGLVLGGAVEGRTERALWEASRGAPLFLRELVLDGLERGALLERDGLWSWHGELGRGRRLRELVAARIGTLDEAEQRVLDAVALGEPVGFAWLNETTAADDLVRRGVLEARADRRRAVVRFAHPLYGEVVRAGIPPARMRAALRWLADALASSGTRRRGDLLRLASWRLASGDEVDVDLLLSAARSAELAFTPALAERFSRAAEQAGGGFEARFAIASAVAAQGRPAEAEASLEELGVEAATDVERAMIAEGRARLLAGGLARGDEAARLVENARSSVGDRTWQAKLTLARAWIRWRQGWPEQAADEVAGLVDDDTLDEEPRLSAAIFRAHMLAHAGRGEDATTLTEHWSSVAKGRGEAGAGLRAEAEFARAVALFLAGWLEHSAAAADKLYSEALDGGDLDLLGRAAFIRGVVALTRGRTSAALITFRECIQVMREIDSRGLLPWTLAMIAQTAGQAGDADAAATALDAATTEAARSPDSWIYSGSIELGRCWMHAAEGALVKARASALAGAEACDSRGQRIAGALAFHDLARLGGARDAAARLARLAEHVQGPMVRACADHAAALVDRNGAALSGVAGAFETIGSPLLAAEALIEASAVFGADGRASSARACASRAQALLAHCPGARTPTLATATETSVLTEREREIAVLAAAGLSNRAIAERLVVSVRTVENQLQRSYGKLGINSRRELAALLGSSRDQVE